MNTRTSTLEVILIVGLLLAVTQCEPQYDESGTGGIGQRYGRGRYGMNNYYARYGRMGGLGQRMGRGYGGYGGLGGGGALGQGLYNRYGLYNRNRFGSGYDMNGMNGNYGGMGDRSSSGSEDQ